MTRIATIAADGAQPVTLQFVPYRDIAIAPENLRAKEPADAGIPRLADTIRAVGLLVPLLVRAGERRDPKPAMALDGRRRLLALAVLIEAGVIADDYPVPVIFSPDSRAARSVNSSPPSRAAAMPAPGSGVMAVSGSGVMAVSRLTVSPRSRCSREDRAGAHYACPSSSGMSVSVYTVPPGPTRPGSVLSRGVVKRLPGGVDCGETPTAGRGGSDRGDVPAPVVR